MEMVLNRSTRFVTVLGFSPMFVTKNLLDSVRFIQCTDPRRWKFKLTERYPCYGRLSCTYVPIFNRITVHQLPFRCNIYKNDISVACYCNSKQSPKENNVQSESPKKMSVFAKMKQMTKDYWHVLLPVHIVTSLGWVAIFYAAIKNGVDIPKLLEFMKCSQKYLDMVQRSDAGNWALTYVLYKLFTPLRYTVTLGLTTMAIKRLSKTGYVKPLPFGKHATVIPKTTESNKSMATHKTAFKTERQVEPPKT
ncbi:protein FAM210A isoform X1 [Colletes gigas]|uniref:protein FAM210A isoform X1 n=1 Tax=Colletes gigas TaxID=935657 RepID=UPI001C9AA998|nr:protein FAM210A isoform X1 [Colletes gigas]